MIPISPEDCAEVIAHKVSIYMKEILFDAMSDIVLEADITKLTSVRAIRLIVERWGGEDV